MTHERQATDVATEDLHHPHSFPTTRWTMVVEAVRDRNESGQAALETLCRTYWPPLYAFARRQGLSPTDAEDLTQGFFDYLLKHGTLALADSARGRFRNFLLTSFRNFHSSQLRSARAEKRGSGRPALSLDAMHETETHLRYRPTTNETPDKLYDRAWAMRTFAESLDTVEREYSATGKAALFDSLKCALWGGRGEVPYAGIARRHATTERAIQVAAYRLRKRVGKQFRQEVAKTVSNPDEVEDEIRHLLAAVSQ